MKKLLFTFILIILPLVSISQTNQFFTVSEVSKPRTPQVWDCDGYLVIHDSIATFIVKYRGDTRGIQGNISGYETLETKNFCIQRFYVVGKGFTIGNLLSFEIKESKSNDNVTIRVYKKLSHYNLIYKSKMIK